jgi:hypothetical protein
LQEAYKLLKAERERIEHLKESHIQLEHLAKKLEEIAVKERQRANRLEDELISQSNRKSAKKSSGSYS